MKKSWAHVRDWKCPAMCYQMVFIIPTPHWRVTMLPLHQSCPLMTRKPDLSKSYRMKVSIFLLFFCTILLTLYQFTILFKYDWWMKNASIYWYKWVKSTGVSYSFCFLTPLLWCLVVWNMNCEDRKGTSRFIFEVVYVWPFVACALGFGFYFQKMVSVFFLSVSNGMAP